MPNRVEISIEGPIQENLARIVVSDDHDNDTFTLDFADVESRRKEGQSSVLDLIIENASGRAIDTLQAAVENGSPVSLDGEDLTIDTLRSALGREQAPKAG